MNLRESIRRILREESDGKYSFPYEILEYVYKTTPVSEYGSLGDYMNYVNEYYQNYYITKHSSPSDSILKSKIKTPEQLGIDYNSADGFFVTPNLDPNTYYSYNKKGKDTNYYVMIPKDLNFLNTDYDLSNIPNFYEDKKFKTPKDLYKYIGDKVRELGYDVIVPDKGEYEWIVVNPEQLIVLGSETDIEQFLSR